MHCLHLGTMMVLMTEVFSPNHGEEGFMNLSTSVPQHLFVLLAFLVLQSFSINAESAIHRASQTKQNKYVDKGVFIGGEAGNAFSLINVRRYYYKKKKMERVVLDLGDDQGKPLKNSVSYFNVALDKNPARVVIELDQVKRAALNESQLRKRFKKSPIVKGVEFIYDPEDQSSSIVLNLKRRSQIEVLQIPSKKKASRIVIDLKLAAKASL